ncbi:DNA mismatch repair protein MutS domain protein [Gluconacetobacter diazotrophicus PA1 5]|uniref:DNA mismatch repair protein MutS n=1 Tax=Gluconacetobacter diazotrophicus TaxID=33996 RepID=A0A7W4I863_GLUDI|nr:DNA mismatch repair protein MutS [Gluconacetobacter diazotrophicus]ACI52386.1 DNA mismatch repair protein MutS domain protein [Gluconacetobacter diazotrophicus PA1 5]MBB2158079.1 DNA mismatch repair protein MutS [Gluconacetobacter diazotrophicus]TWB05517.1 MutS-like protein [Gluconacetobacter diazotrophicus]
MKAHLLFRDRDLDPKAPLPPQADALIDDLRLNVIFDAMAAGDELIARVSPRVMLNTLADPEDIRYRQEITSESLDREDLVRELYSLASDAIEAERKSYIHAGFRSPGSIVFESVSVLKLLLGTLTRLRAISDAERGRSTSRGLRTLFETLSRELDDPFFERIRGYISDLSRPRMLFTARLGVGNKATDHVLRKPLPPEGNWLARAFAGKPEGYSFRLNERDESGARALSDIRDRALNRVADALGQGKDHVLAFLNALRNELAFYVGAINLHARLVELALPTCLPDFQSSEDHDFAATGLYDVALALTSDRQVVGNDIDATGPHRTVIITGANQGGKTTFLRSVGLSFVMGQCGLFAGAGSPRTGAAGNVFTHFKREEDRALESGKFDEELHRMSVLVDQLRPHSVMLLNESFASTNDREGSDISYEIVSSLQDVGVRVFFVTHQYSFAHRFFANHRADTLFLRPERLENGTRTFRLRPGEPETTSYGQDLYARIFGHALPRHDTRQTP